MTFEIRVGDALTELRAMPAESVHCVVTSPPYWGLRDYGVEGQIGLEESIDVWLERLVAVFAEVRRVLRKDGTLWVNMGDAHAHGSDGGAGRRWRPPSNGRGETQDDRGRSSVARRPRAFGTIKPKDLIGQPWMLAFALRTSGWYLRRDIIWHKPNPMPESTKDRPTTAHEYLFLLSKRARYFYDATAIMEPTTGTSHPRVAGWSTAPGAHRVITHNAAKMAGANSRAHKDRSPRNRKYNSSFTAAIAFPVAKRQRRSVWTIATKAYRGAHFATFPPKLVEPCILAGCPEGGVVLDPFAGSGTTGAVAIAHGRCFIGIELNPAYAELARERCAAAERAGRQLAIPGVA